MLRQAGTIGVIKVASVEVHERTTHGLARADPTELSSQLRFQTDRAIVLAYKYHTARHALTISVINHEEMPVLKAVVDKLYYEALVVEDNTMHRMLMTLQTTGQMQYLRINNIPSDATIWSVLVNSIAVKPSKGSEGTLLVQQVIVPCVLSWQSPAVIAVYVTHHYLQSLQLQRKSFWALAWRGSCLAGAERLAAECREHLQ